MTDKAKIQKDRINSGFSKTANLAKRVFSSGNRSQDQGMVKRHDQRAMSRAAQDSAEPDFLATIAQRSPLYLNTRR